MLKCLLLEPTRDFHVPLVEMYSRIFYQAGYDSVFDCVLSEKDARILLNEKNIDIFICDLSFNTEDNAGLLVVRSVKTDFPDVFIIGNSGADIGYRQVAAKLPSFDMFIEKGLLYSGDDKYINNIIKELLTKFRRNPYVNVSEESEVSEDVLKKIKKRDFQSLISQVLYVSGTVNHTVMPENMLLQPLTGGRSSSIVYKLSGRNKNNIQIAVPAVLKISPIENAVQEKDNYEKFVKWIVPYSWRVDVLGFGVTKKWGAICYSFIKSGYDDFDSLTKFIENGDDEIIYDVISKIFDPSKRHWYSENFLSKAKGINERYYQRYFCNGNNKNESDRLFKKYIQDLFDGKISERHFEAFGKKYKYPIERVFHVPSIDYHTCICHGDMNSNNLIVSENGEVIFIDFQDTGIGHVFEDFITVESGVRINYKNNKKQYNLEEWLSYINDERAMSSANCDDYLSSINKHLWRIRQYAKENFPFEDQKNYHYSVIAYNLRLLRLKGLTSNQIGKLLSAIIIALENIDQISH